jgi:hypothetical protein
VLALQASDPRKPVFGAEIIRRSAAVSAASAFPLRENRTPLDIKSRQNPKPEIRNPELGTHFAKMTFSHPVNLGHEKSRLVIFGGRSGSAGVESAKYTFSNPVNFGAKKCNLVPFGGLQVLCVLENWTVLAILAQKPVLVARPSRRRVPAQSRCMLSRHPPYGSGAHPKRARRVKPALRIFIPLASRRRRRHDSQNQQIL